MRTRPLPLKDEHFCVIEEQAYVLRDDQAMGLTAIQVKDLNVYMSQRDPRSSDEFLAPKFTADVHGKSEKNKAKRVEHMTKQFEQMAQDLQQPTANANIRTIKDEQFFDYQKMYALAQTEGRHETCEFQPVVVYRDRVSRARKIFAGEVGVYVKDGVRGMRAGNRPEIIVLEQGFGTGNFVQVKGGIKDE